MNKNESQQRRAATAPPGGQARIIFAKAAMIEKRLAHWPKLRMLAGPLCSS